MRQVPDRASSCAKRISSRQRIVTRVLPSQERDAILAVLDDPPAGLEELRGALARITAIGSSPSTRRLPGRAETARNAAAHRDTESSIFGFRFRRSGTGRNAAVRGLRS